MARGILHSRIGVTMRKRSRLNPYGAVVLLTCVLLHCAAAAALAGFENQRAFEKPEMAVNVLADAVRTADSKALEEIFGPQGRAVLTSGDPVADKNARQVFAVAVGQQWKLRDVEADKKE